MPLKLVNVREVIEKRYLVKTDYIDDADKVCVSENKTQKVEETKSEFANIKEFELANNRKDKLLSLIEGKTYKLITIPDIGDYNFKEFPKYVLCTIEKDEVYSTFFYYGFKKIDKLKYIVRKLEGDILGVYDLDEDSPRLKEIEIEINVNFK